MTQVRTGFARFTPYKTYMDTKISSWLDFFSSSCPSRPVILHILLFKEQICQNKQYHPTESYGTYSTLFLSSTKQQSDNSLSDKRTKYCSSSMYRIPEFIIVPQKLFFHPNIFSRDYFRRRIFKIVYHRLLAWKPLELRNCV